MKKTIEVARLWRGNPRLDDLLKKTRAGPLHRVQQFVVALDPGDVVGPTAALRVKAWIFPFEFADYFRQLFRAGAGTETVPDSLLEEGLQCRKVFLPDAERGQVFQILAHIHDRCLRARALADDL